MLTTPDARSEPTQDSPFPPFNANLAFQGLSASDDGIVRRRTAKPAPAGWK